MKYTLILLFSILLSCNDFQSKSMNQPNRPIEEIQKEVFGGNIDSYVELKTIYLDYPPEEFLFWAILMANKYDYPEAYLDVFRSIIYPYGSEYPFDKLDKRTKKIAMEYLLLASKKNVLEASEILKNMKK